MPVRPESPATTPQFKLVLHGRLSEEEEGYRTQQQLLLIFEKALALQQRKNRIYGDAFRSQGYMGNVARVLSKVSRLRNMMWTDLERRPPEETIEDTLMDLINLAAFTLINLNNRNKWGKEHG